MLRFLRSAACAMFAAIMAILTVVLSAGPLLVMREQEGRVAFFAWTSVLIGAGIYFNEPALYFTISAAALLVFYFYELEAAGFSMRRSAALSVIASSLLLFFAFVVWVRHLGFAPIDYLRGHVEFIANQTKTLPSGMQIVSDQILPIVPAVFVCSLGMLLWLALLTEPAMQRLIYRSSREVRPVRGLERFRVPAGFIWPFILSIAGAFIEQPYIGIQGAFLNIFVVLMFVYFLQGVAILSYFFSVTRTGAIWRILIYALMVGNLAPFLAGLGVADFWLDFRTKLRRKATEPVA